MYHIQNISAIRKLIPESASAQLVHSLVTSQLYYYNSLFFGIQVYKRKQVQRIKNIAASVLMLTPCFPQHHITEVLNDLHWLLVKKRIFKILLLT